MKNKILITLCLALLLIASCRKDEEPSESITGHVYEEGTGNPVSGADVFLIAQEYGSWPVTKQMAHAKTDQNGAFTIKNTRHPDISRHFLAAQGYDYYELYESDKTKYEAKETTSRMDLYLFRKANLKVRVVNTGAGESIEITSKRQVLIWDWNLIYDTTLNLAVECFIDNNITYFPVTAGVKSRRDTILFVEPDHQDTLLLYY